MTRPIEDERIDWKLTTWEGSRREQLRRWSELPLEQVILALEEMEELSILLRHAPTIHQSGPAARGVVK
ncbi:MAG: hypothetical protein ACKVQA_14460 [Burkholderiales bacterium]